MLAINSTRLQVETIMPSATAGCSASLLQASGKPRFRNGQPLAHLDRRGLVIDADELESHDAINLCIPLK